jgi:hypothetical protein
MSDAFALSLGAAMTGKKQHLPLPHFHLLLLQQPLHLTTCPHCAHRAQGTRENHGPCLRGRPLPRHVAVAIRRPFASEAPHAPPTANYFSTYPAVNANYRGPPFCCSCAPHIPSAFSGMYNFNP